MKNSYTNNIVVPAEGTFGKAPTSAFAEIMNLMIKILTKLGLSQKGS
jgi:hypothetical protein